MPIFSSKKTKVRRMTMQYVGTEPMYFSRFAYSRVKCVSGLRQAWSSTVLIIEQTSCLCCELRKCSAT